MARREQLIPSKKLNKNQWLLVGWGIVMVFG
jgi:hypothetical protein